MSEDLILRVGGANISGWTDISVTRGIERVPSSFQIGMTALDPKSGVAAAVREGQACEVVIGADKIITGYVDQKIIDVSDRGRTLTLIGRGKCADLVDCSAEWPGGQIVGANALAVATKLAAIYGISVSASAGADLGPAVPQFNLNYGETPYSIIERVTRAAGLLAYEDANGNLLLAALGKVTASSGVAYAQNAQAYRVALSVDQRFSDIVCEQLSTDTLGDLGEGGWAYFKAPDPNVTRHRLMYLVAEQNVPDPFGLCQKKALWEVARRRGRSQEVRATVDSWRDAGGTLWTPNTLVPVDLPELGSKQLLCLSEVSYSRDDERGTVADLVLMPPEAFTPEPTVLQPSGVAEAI